MVVGKDAESSHFFILFEFATAREERHLFMGWKMNTLSA